MRRRSKKQVMVALASGAGGVLALASVAWACTVHWGTLTVCAAPRGVAVGAGCAVNEGSTQMSGPADPGVPYNKTTAAATTAVAQPGATLVVSGQTWPNTSDYSLHWYPSANHSDCHGTNAISMGSVFKTRAGAFGPITYTLPSPLPINANYKGVAWVCLDENRSTRGQINPRVPGSPGDLPAPLGGSTGLFSNAALGMAVPFRII